MEEDFGFSFASEVSEDDMEKTNNAFSEYRDAVNSFLNKLALEPSKEVIKWPNRTTDIASFQNKLDDIFLQRKID